MNFAELTTFIGHIIKHAPEEIHVFFSFVDQAVEAGFYKFVKREDFNDFCKMIYIFSKEGLLRIEDKDTAERKTAVAVTDG